MKHCLSRSGDADIKDGRYSADIMHAQTGHSVDTATSVYGVGPGDMKYLYGHMLDQFWAVSQKWHSSLGLQGECNGIEQTTKQACTSGNVKTSAATVCQINFGNVMNRMSRLETLLTDVLERVSREGDSNVGEQGVVKKKRRLLSQNSSDFRTTSYHVKSC